MRTAPLTSPRISRCVAALSAFLALMALVVSPANAGPAYTEVIKSATTTWIVPDGVTSIDILCVGGGGGGGGGWVTTVDVGYGGGGGGGRVRTLTSVAVTAGSTLAVTVGSGGAAGAVEADGAAGGTSELSVQGGGVLCTAAGGAGGKKATAGGGGAGGMSGSANAGGVASGNYAGGGGGDTTVGAAGVIVGMSYRGGNGGTGTTPSSGLFYDYVGSIGGGGGGGGGDASYGLGTGGGGDGGVGHCIRVATAGAANSGGGGGGGCREKDNVNSVGAAGGSGLIVIRYASGGGTGGGGTGGGGNEPPMTPVPGSDPTFSQSGDNYTCASNEWTWQISDLKISIIVDGNYDKPLVDQVVYDMTLPKYTDGMITVNATTKGKYTVSATFKPTDGKAHTLMCIVTARGLHSVGSTWSQTNIAAPASTPTPTPSPTTNPATESTLQTVSATVYFASGRYYLRQHPIDTLNNFIDQIQGELKACKITGFVQPTPRRINDYSLSLNRAVMTMSYLYAKGLSTTIAVSTRGRAQELDWVARRAEVSCTFDPSKAAPMFKDLGDVVTGQDVGQPVWPGPKTWEGAPDGSIRQPSELAVIPAKVFALDYNVLRVMFGLPGLTTTS